MFKAIHVPDFGAPFRDVEIVTSGKLPELVRTYGALALLMHNSVGLNMANLHAMAADITIQLPPPSGRSQTSSDIPLCWLLRCVLRIAPQLARRRPVEGSAIKRCDINHFCCIPTLSPPHHQAAALAIPATTCGVFTDSLPRGAAFLPDFFAAFSTLTMRTRGTHPTAMKKE